MFLKSLLVGICLFSFKLYGFDLNVTSSKTQYHLEFKENKSISIKGDLLNLNMNYNKCNTHIIDRFSHRVKKLLKSKHLRKSKQSGDFSFKFNNTQYFERSRSKLGYLLENLPREFHRLKIEEKLRCEK